MTACDFCSLNPAEGTMTRQGPEGTFTMQLCARCMLMHQFVVRVAATEHQMGARMCLKCGRAADIEGQSQDREGRFLGRFAVCRQCAAKMGTLAADLLRRATPWTPGIIELPPLNERPFLPPLQPPRSAPDPTPPPASALGPKIAATIDATKDRWTRPPVPDLDPQVAALRRELEAAVHAEDYMRAAELRDEIRRREGGQ